MCRFLRCELREALQCENEQKYYRRLNKENKEKIRIKQSKNQKIVLEYGYAIYNGALIVICKYTRLMLLFFNTGETGYVSIR